MEFVRRNWEVKDWRKTDHGNGSGNGNGNGKLASNALLHSMALDVGNYAKVKRKTIFIGGNVMRIGDGNTRWLNDQ